MECAILQHPKRRKAHFRPSVDTFVFSLLCELSPRFSSRPLSCHIKSRQRWDLTFQHTWGDWALLKMFRCPGWGCAQWARAGGNQQLPSGGTTHAAAFPIPPSAGSRLHKFLAEQGENWSPTFQLPSFTGCHNLNSTWHQWELHCGLGAVFGP